MSETRMRSIAKTISYRALMVVATWIIMYILTGGIVFATIITVGIQSVKTLIYWFHERVWNKLEWGRG